MRVVKDEKSQVVKTENTTAAPANGLYCARNPDGTPVSESGRIQEGITAPEPRATRRAPAAAATS